ncbi:MAG: DinB family protein [Planctomycetaceae bacterium]
METQSLTIALGEMKLYFDRSTRVLTEEDADFAPEEGMFSTAQQMAHVAQTVEWFVKGAFSPDGFDTDFSALEKAVRKVKTLAEARDWLDRAFAYAIETLGSKSVAELQAPIAPGPIMGGAPRGSIVAGINDHTAHHRGALTVYARLRGKTSPMPYGE